MGVPLELQPRPHVSEHRLQQRRSQQEGPKCRCMRKRTIVLDHVLEFAPKESPARRWRRSQRTATRDSATASHAQSDNNGKNRHKADGADRHVELQREARVSELRRNPIPSAEEHFWSHKEDDLLPGSQVAHENRVEARHGHGLRK